jgi:DNA-binding NarL/FixJ family response regulator
MISGSIIGDSAGLREPIVTFINSAPGFSCISAYSNGDETILRLPGDAPEVVLMDVNMPGMNGIECASRLKTIAPKMQIIMLTVYGDSDQIFDAFVAGASGHLLKLVTPEELLEAIKDVREGGAPMSSFIACKVVASFQRLRRNEKGGQNFHLAPKEQMILERLVKGKTYKEICGNMDISTNLTLPLSQWRTNSAGLFDGNGNLSTNSANAATEQIEFHILKQ